MGNDKVKCPECGADAVIATDGRSFCQGLKIPAEDVRKAEQAVKVAVSSGADTAAADLAFRTISVQKVCGAIMYRDDQGTWRRVVPGPGQ